MIDGIACCGPNFVIGEDAGFHLFAILFVLIALNRWHGMPWSAQRAEVSFAAIALAFSLAEILLQMLVAQGQSSLVRIYLGDPPFGSLSPQIIAERLLGYVSYRTYLVLPAVIAVFWAARTRNPYILVGYIAFVDIRPAKTTRPAAAEEKFLNAPAVCEQIFRSQFRGRGVYRRPEVYGDAPMSVVVPMLSNGRPNVGRPAATDSVAHEQ